MKIQGEGYLYCSWNILKQLLFLVHVEKSVGDFVRRKKDGGRISSRIFFPIDLSFTEEKNN